MELKQIDDFMNSWWPIIISFIITAVATVRLYVGGTKCPSTNRIDNKVVLITGASSGIGLATAKELALRGGKIILTCRNKSKGEEAIKMIKSTNPAASIDLRIMDISSMKQIHNFTSEIKRDYDKIDVLINNAGIIFHQYTKTSENLELTFATNYLGPFLLSHLLVPLLNKSDNGRIINITSLAHFYAKIDVDNLNFSKEFIYREVFGQTKLALVLFTKYFGGLLKSTNITVNCVNPGIVRDTNHLQNSPLGSSWMTRVSVYPWTWLFLKNPKQGCQSILYAAIDSSLDKVTGTYISDCEIKEPSELSKDEILLEKLYTKSCLQCNLKPETVLNDIKQN